MGEPEPAAAQISSRFPQLPQKPKMAPEQGTQEMLRGLSRSQRGQDHIMTATGRRLQGMLQTMVKRMTALTIIRTHCSLRASSRHRALSSDEL